MCSAGGSHGSYLFTSHVGAPLCCWDKRNMSLPVHESQQLGSYSRAYPPMPLPPPQRAAAHSAMWLECDPGGDLLVGRAENGAQLPSMTSLSRGLPFILPQISCAHVHQMAALADIILRASRVCRHDVALGPDRHPRLAGCFKPVAWPGVLADALCRRALGGGASCPCTCT